MKETLLPEGKVAYVPGATFFPVDQEPNHARVNFSGVEDDQIVEGISRLGKLLKQTL
jgi:2-aminoadipate transaminase